MNKYDSELVAGILTGHGFHLVHDEQSADVVLINTCGVREHAENRALSHIDRLLAWKRRQPGRVVGMLGCLPCLIGKELLELRPDLNFAVGPDGYLRLPELITDAAMGKIKQGMLIDEPSGETYGDVAPVREPGVRAWVAVSRGCDNWCSYCMVPLARGKVRCRPVEEVVFEVEAIVADDFAEVVLLGQNVNAYRSGGVGFGALLRKVATVPGLRRVRFMTSHPKDLDDDLIDALAAGGAICPDLHLPVQSGSDRILKAMNRGYTRAEYMKLIEKLRERVPDLGLSTDVIVGFPGETEDDFNQTLSLFEAVGYASGFVFRYSPRPGTAAFLREDDVPDEVKTKRLIRLNDALAAARAAIHESLFGRTLEVLIEGTARKHPDQATGRSREGYVVALPANGLKPGDIVAAEVQNVRGFTLLARQVESAITTV
jgi:tRNA-2-methylthio-N6-dimethylallyladenosine synthase